MSEEVNKESLEKSIKLVGELYPILENQDGKILDGNTRAASNPKHHRKTIQTKSRSEEILIRVHAHHRRRIPQEETKAMLVELAEEFEKSGIPKETITTELCKVVPFSERYVRQLMPQEYKQPEKVEAGKVSAELTPHIVKIQDMVECERCHVASSEPTVWHNHNLCPTCFDRAKLNPESYDGYFRTLERKPKLPEPKGELKPRDFDSYAEKQAHMKVGKSEMENLIVEAIRKHAAEFGFKRVWTDETIVVHQVTTMPDWNAETVNGKIVRGYIDGEVHVGRRDRDEELRGLLRKVKPCDLILAVDVKGKSERMVEEKLMEIKEALKWS